tara:strand:- start:625 stop:1416 length:792 start_codon:yes stop_codon:yes gene_type:complete
MDFLERLKKDGFVNVKLPKNSVINDILDILEKKSTYLLNIPSTDEYHVDLLEIQNDINKLSARNRLLKELKNELNLIHDSSIFGAQTVVYLRGVRPINKESKIKHEALPMHRENFYCDEEYINHQLNMHFPLNNYNMKTSMKYYPKSHLLPDTDLILDKKDSRYSGVDRYSKAHRLGLPYNPKIIDNLAELGEPISAPCREGDAFLFSSKLIHGGGLNYTNAIRFSLDFATIPRKWIKEQKKQHFASYEKTNSHFVEICLEEI